MTVREVVKILKKDGWYQVDSKGSHMQFRHPTKKGKVTVANHKGDIPIRTLKSIYIQAGLK
ncbi:MAG: type II toxin-antitoxin system HicA family toxin [Erysipelotrichaceae bacterium]|nr:type II toxin-antitoxin system HicA family toxin [Erysipelotrichaceae bacterium]